MNSKADLNLDSIRPRRLRRTPAIRSLLSKTYIHSNNLILPIFIKEGLKNKTPIVSMPGVFQHNIKSAEKLIEDALKVGIFSFALFGIPDKKDLQGKNAIDPNGVLQSSVSSIKDRFQDAVTVIPDLCLDEFLIHGHCGVLNSKNQVDNDATVAIYAEMAVSLAEAGADMVAPSGMMDGQVKAIRKALDGNGHSDCSILSYSVKFASSAYGPFREAVEVNLTGDRKTYQQDIQRSYQDAMCEAQLDETEGADILMVKPAIFNLDIISKLEATLNVPIFAYQVSGEYSMIKTCADAGYINYTDTMYEALNSIFRAGATAVLTYGALDIARHLNV